MQLDLTDEEIAALARLLTNTIDADRYPLSPRSDIEGHSREDPTGAGPRAHATAEGLCAAASHRH
jgi:hypothetical protein